jgi:hypothetical protein
LAGIGEVLALQLAQQRVKLAITNALPIGQQSLQRVDEQLALDSIHRTDGALDGGLLLVSQNHSDSVMSLLSACNAGERCKADSRSNGDGRVQANWIAIS